MIKGVQAKHLKVIADERGRLMEILRNDDKNFQEFGQAYMTTCYPNVIKAWHMHTLQTDNICCLFGMIKLVLAKVNNKGSSTINEFIIGTHNPMIITIPKKIYHGFMCISEQEALVLNIPTLRYNHITPDEYRLAYNTYMIEYDWTRKNG